MKKVLVAIMLALGVTASAQQSQTPPAGAQPGSTAQAEAAQPQQKTIKDPAEYNSYVGAVQLPDAASRIVALEDFLVRYPNSVVREDGLQALLGVYQQTGNVPKAVETANKLLQINPNNLAALAILVLVNRSDTTANAQQKILEAGQLAQRGLQALQTAPKPEGVSDADWSKQKQAFSVVFSGAAGVAALQQKDYARASQSLQVAVEGNPNNLQDVYPLAVAYLEMRPANVQGLWYAARAVNLAPAQAQAQISAWARNRYVKFHGGEDGWAELLAQAKTAPLPPAGFAVKPAPTAAELAGQLVQTKSVNQMSPDELELVLTSGNQAAADKVWAGLKGVPQQFVGQVVAPGKTQLQVAFTYDSIQASRANVELTMAGVIPANLMPKAGEQIKLQGTPVSYTVTPATASEPPALLIKMSDGALLTAKAPAARKKHTPRRRR